MDSSIESSIYVPALFFKNGKFCNDIVERVWSIVPKPGGAKKWVLKEVLDQSRSDVNEAFEEIVSDPKLLAKWFDYEALADRSLSKLAKQYAIFNDKSFRFESLASKAFIKVHSKELKSRYTFRLDKLDLFVAMLKAYKGSVESLALYVWATIIDNRLAVLKYPLEAAYADFEASLLNTLKVNGCDDILELIKPISIERPKQLNQNQPLPRPAVVSCSAISERELKALDEFNGRKLAIRKIDERARDFCSGLERLVARVNTLSYDRTLLDNVGALGALLSSQSEEGAQIIAEAKIAYQSFLKELNDALEVLALGAESTENELGFEKTGLSTKSLHAVSKAIVDVGNLLSSTAEVSAREVVFESYSCDVADVVSVAQARLEDVKRRRIVRESYERFATLLTAKLYDLSWNVLQEESVEVNVWQSIFNHHSSKPHPILGVAASRSYKDTKNELAQLLIRELNVHGALNDCINILSCLNAGQLEDLARANEELKVLICLVLVESFIASKQSWAQSFALWSVYPLSEAYVAISSENTRGFFSALYAMASSENGALNTRALKIGLTGSKSSVSDDKNKTLALIESKLIEALTYRRKGGGVTYVQIWQAAHNEVVQPLLLVYQSDGLAKFFDFFNSWLKSFEVEKSIEGWKSEIPEHLKKNSVYDKFARTQINLKLNEIEELEIEYKGLIAPRKFKDNELQRLTRAIDGLGRSRDRDSALIKSWLESKLVNHTELFNPYLSLERDLDGGIDFSGFAISEFYPRSFSAMLNGLQADGFLVTDLIYKSLGLSTPEILTEAYLRNNFVDGNSAILADPKIDLAPELERRAEKQVEDAIYEVEEGLNEISNYLAIDTDGTLAQIISEIKSLLNGGRIRKAQLLLSDCVKVADRLSRAEEEKKDRENILCRLNLLRDVSFNSSWGVAELEKHYAKILGRYSARRKHIVVLEKLKSIRGRGVSEKISSCLAELESLDRYPEALVSDVVALYWEQAVDPLIKELSRSKTLLPQYVDKLHQLIELFIEGIASDPLAVSEESVLNRALLNTAEHWARLPDEGAEAADRIITLFDSHGLSISKLKIERMSGYKARETNSNSNSPAVEVEEHDNVGIIALARKVIGNRRPAELQSIEMSVLIESSNWEAVVEVSASQLQSSGFYNAESLDNWTISSVLSGVRDIGMLGGAYALKSLNVKAPCSVARFLLSDRNSKSIVENLSISFLVELACAYGWEDSTPDFGAPKLLDCMNYLVACSDESLKSLFRLAYSPSAGDSVSLKFIWERFSGGQRQAEGRALLMQLCWRMRSPESFAFCLALPPIDLDKRKSQALSLAADEALATGDSSLLQPFIDLKATLTARPFHILVDLMSRSEIDHNVTPAVVSVVSDLEQHSDDIYRASISFEPRRVDSPDSLILQLPGNGPLRFMGGAISQKFSGPFLSATTLPVAFEIVHPSAYNFELEVGCAAVSITGKKSEFKQLLRFTIRGGGAFNPVPVELIEEAFDSFPVRHMRGANYVPRIIDEQKIEKALFISKAVRSLWITSPRRSGKTSMLFRILDGYSHKAGRDSAVVYLTLDESFASVADFNKWIWRRIRTVKHNAELRSLYDNFDEIGRALDFECDAGTFIGALADELIENTSSMTRIIFLIDEVDRFAGMYSKAAEERDTATNILWQIRNYIGERRDIGVVFAGSSAAREIFIKRAESPFYNSIDHLELTPFSTKTSSQEEYSRQLVEPAKLKGVYTIPVETLDHIIWVCAGIPYYMKLVAGSTMARAKQSYLLKSDVNEGVRALLGKDTGIGILDSMGGDPGSDDLRTIVGVEKSSDGLLARAVLYAFSDMHSSISGNRTYRGRLSSSESRLVSLYKLPKPLIERGLDVCLSLGLLRLVEGESVPELDFVIPLLGESLRKSSQRLWATIDHELLNISEFEGA